MKEQTPHQGISRRDFLRLAANTVMGSMALESGFLIIGRNGYIDSFLKTDTQENTSEDGLTNYAHAIMDPIKKPFLKSEDTSIERKLSGWVWYAMGVFGQALIMLDNVDEFEDRNP